VRIAELRVKIKSLAAEARIIAQEERRVLDRVQRLSDTDAKDRAWNTYHELRGHRRTVVGRGAREALLAYGFLRGHGYERLEPPNSSAPDWDSVYKTAERFAHPPDRAALAARWPVWREGAEKYRQSSES
jgi:hypothetical protein